MNQHTNQQTPWYLGRLAGFDTETTGISVDRDRIVTACVVQCGGNQPAASATWLSNLDGQPIPEAATAVHGITTEQAHSEGRPAAEVIEQIITALTAVALSGIPVVAMNASFDFTILDREARRHGVQPLTETVGDDLRVIDPFVLDKKIDPYRRGKRTLTALCEHYKVPLDGAHDAAADALAACRVAWRIGQREPELGAASLDFLHDKQTDWAREQAESLADYFRNTPGKEDRAKYVRGDWPLIPHQRTEGQ